MVVVCLLFDVAILKTKWRANNLFLQTKAIFLKQKVSRSPNNSNLRADGSFFADCCFNRFCLFQLFFTTWHERESAVALVHDVFCLTFYPAGGVTVLGEVDSLLECLHTLTPRFSQVCHLRAHKKLSWKCLLKLSKIFKKPFSTIFLKQTNYTFKYKTQWWAKMIIFC